MKKEGSLPEGVITPKGHTLAFGKEVGPIAVTKPKEPDGDDRRRRGIVKPDELGPKGSVLILRVQLSDSRLVRALTP
jgi:hypothetical protein